MSIILGIIIIWWVVSIIKRKSKSSAEDKNYNNKMNELTLKNEQLQQREVKLANKERELSGFANRIAKANKELDALKAEQLDLNNQINDLYDKSLIHVYPSEVQNNLEEVSSAEIKNELSIMKLNEKELRSKNAVRVPTYRNKREQNNLKKKILTLFDSEVTGLINKLTVANIDSTRNRIVKTYNKVNKLFKDEDTEINQGLLESKLHELELNYSFILKQNDEKEQQHAIKEQMLDEAKAQRELDKEKKRIEKESHQFSNELDKMMRYLSKSTDSVQNEIYSEKIKELELKIEQLEKDKSDIANRELNTRAGYVYIISNVGSFGENIYKIGMTKRLDPMDRIKELSSASVPFEFDVHATI